MAAPAHHPLDLAAFLSARGFVAVPLTVNGVGHAEAVIDDSRATPYPRANGGRE